MIEFLRFGSQIPGGYHGCCGVDIIQGFGCHPDAKASIQVTDGDSGLPYTRDGEFVFLGPTNLDVFKQRLRIGTFYHKELTNHAFFAILTDDQINAPYSPSGKLWLAILKEHGFEFIRAVSNSVYSSRVRPMYIFGLFRNIGDSKVDDPFAPPKAWTDLPDCKLSQQEVWDRDRLTLLSAEDLIEAKAPVMLAGKKAAYNDCPRPMVLTKETEKAPLDYVDALPIEDDEDEVDEDEDDLDF